MANARAIASSLIATGEHSPLSLSLERTSCTLGAKTLLSAIRSGDNNSPLFTHLAPLNKLPPVPPSFTAFREDLVSRGIIVAAETLVGPAECEYDSAYAHVMSGGSANVKALRCAETEAFMVALFSTITENCPGIDLSPTDLYHGHMFLDSHGDIGILFHAKEFPLEYSRSARSFYPVGHAEMGGNLDPRLGTKTSVTDKDYHLRNFIWSTSAPGSIALLDPRQDGFPSDVLQPGAAGKCFASVSAFAFGLYLGDINYFGANSKGSVMVVLARSEVAVADPTDRLLFVLDRVDAIASASVKGARADAVKEHHHPVELAIQEHMSVPELVVLQKALSELASASPTAATFLQLAAAVQQQREKANEVAAAASWDEELGKLQAGMPDVAPSDASIALRLTGDLNKVDCGASPFSALKATQLLAVARRKHRGLLTSEQHYKVATASGGVAKRHCVHLEGIASPPPLPPPQTPKSLEECKDEDELQQEPASEKKNAGGCAACARGKLLCLRCNHRGCGRYEHGHALAHAEHCFHSTVLDTENLSVWCYACDTNIDTRCEALAPHLKWAIAMLRRTNPGASILKQIDPVWRDMGDVDFEVAHTVLSGIHQSCLRADLALDALAEADIAPAAAGAMKGAGKEEVRASLLDRAIENAQIKGRVEAAEADSKAAEQFATALAAAKIDPRTGYWSGVSG